MAGRHLSLLELPEKGANAEEKDAISRLFNLTKKPFLFFLFSFFFLPLFFLSFLLSSAFF